MNPFAVPDLETSLNVRKVLVRHQIDLGWLTHQVCRGTVYIQGSLRTLPGIGDELTPRSVQALFDEIGGSRGVCNVIVELQNWRHNGINCNWKPVEHVAVQKAGCGPNADGANAFAFDEDGNPVS